jgi:hypothetical protein
VPRNDEQIRTLITDWAAAVNEWLKEQQRMKAPQIVSPPEWDEARERLLVPPAPAG